MDLWRELSLETVFVALKAKRVQAGGNPSGASLK